MPEMFEAKVRNVGTSLGILIPKEIAKRENVKIGESVEVSLFRLRKKKEIEEAINKLFGSAKGAKSFRREHKDRIERYE
jgi:antitoxin component of MazEF toxin-antitoxin module